MKGSPTMKFVFALGRVLFSLAFIIKPLEHFTGKHLPLAETMGVPFPSVLVPIWGIIGLIGGLSILLGLFPRMGAWLIVLFLAPITYYMHPFWTQNGFAETMHSLCFWKNLSMLGAALMITYTGSGPLSMTKDRDL